MNWLEVLNVKIDALGDNPTDAQSESLMPWVLDNVPEARWDSIWHLIPSGCATELSMRSAENQTWAHI